MRKMLKEERELREFADRVAIICYPNSESKRIKYRNGIYKLITALVRACYEDAAKVAEEMKPFFRGNDTHDHAHDDACDDIAAAIREGGEMKCSEAEWDYFEKYKYFMHVFDENGVPGLIPIDQEWKRLNTRNAALAGIPDDGMFHHRLAVQGLFGVTERLYICQLLRDHMEGKPIVDRTEENA